MYPYTVVGNNAFTKKTVLTIVCFTKRLQQCMLNRGVTVNDMNIVINNGFLLQRDVRRCIQTLKSQSLHAVPCVL